MRRIPVRLLGLVSLAMFAALPIVDAPAAEPWTLCANEGSRCSFTGTQEVRYGVDTRWTAPRTLTGGKPAQTPSSVIRRLERSSTANVAP